MLGAKVPISSATEVKPMIPTTERVVRITFFS
jgi:hypothetical protein